MSIYNRNPKVSIGIALIRAAPPCGWDADAAGKGWDLEENGRALSSKRQGHLIPADMEDGHDVPL